MEILAFIGVGASVGWLSAIWRRSAAGAASGVAIGVLGALMGVAADAWLRSFGQPTALDGVVASSIGSAVLLLLWVIAQRLFVQPVAGTTRRN